MQALFVQSSAFWQPLEWHTKKKCYELSVINGREELEKHSLARCLEDGEYNLPKGDYAMLAVVF